MRDEQISPPSSEPDVPQQGSDVDPSTVAVEIATEISLPVTPQPEAGKVPVSSEPLFEDFRDGFDETLWWRSMHHNEEPTSHYGGPWMPENVTLTPEGLSLLVTAATSEKRATMGELSTRLRYGYGRYETIMRPSGETGIISAFFVYTGRVFGTPHDEIDIEFAGNMRRRVELNYFSDKQRGAHRKIALSFDASDSFRLYAFDWEPGRLTWYIDGEEVYQTAPGDERVPIHPAKIMVSAWTGAKKMEGWHGVPDFGDTASAEFACVSFTPLGQTSKTCADLYRSDDAFRR